MKNEVNIPCCICSSVNSELIFTTEFPVQNYPGKFIIRKCLGCGLLFNSPRLQDDKLYNLYDKNYYLFKSHVSDEFRRITNVYLRTIPLAEKLLKEKNVVEVGSGKGYLLAILMKLGWTVQGVEISSDATDFSKSKFQIPTYNGTITNYVNEYPTAVYSLVLAIDVIEHVPDPIEFLNNLDRLVAKGGILIIDTPNGNCKNIDYLGKKWAALNPFHIYFFTMPILKDLLLKRGYNIELCFSYGNKLRKIDLLWYVRVASQKLGIFNFLKKIYLWVDEKKDRTENIDLLISESINYIQKSPSYFETDDAKDDLAEDFRGHNIVIVARKKLTDF